MRFGLVHRVMTDTLAALGILALVASGQFPRLVNVLACFGLAVAIALREPHRQKAAEKRIDTIAGVLLVAVQIGRLVFSRASVLDLLIEFAVGLQIIRVATRKGAAHDQQVIVLALLHLIAGTVVGGGLGYGLCLFGLLVVTPGALVLSHLRREVEGNYRQGARDRTGLPVDVPRILRSKRVVGRQFIAVTCLLAVPILLFTVALFVIFPRVGLSLLLLNRPKTGRMIGFSDRVDLGQIGTLRSDPTIALRVTLAETPDPPPARLLMHLRGTALDHYDGRTWSQSVRFSRLVAGAEEPVPVSGYPAPSDPVMHLELEPIEPPVLFLPPATKALRLKRAGIITPGGGLSVLRASEGELRYQSPSDRGVRYEVHLSREGEPSFPALRPLDRPRYVQLPSDLPERVRGLAGKWVEGVAGDLERARRIEQRLRTEFRYDLSSPSGADAQPLDHFLFESKRGHCEYYSTAMAVMLRTLGIPSRAVAGFAGGTYNKFGGFYAVRQGDAHSWVEAFIEGRGWLTFDPTPPAAAVPLTEIDGVLAGLRDFFEAVSQRWDQHVIGYDLRQQMTLLESFTARERATAQLLGPHKRVLLAGLGFLIAALALWWLLRRRRGQGEANERKPEDEQAAREAALATSLYLQLERVMAASGLARARSTPPLGHALALVRGGHALAAEILSLTQLYLEARFGGRRLSSGERQDFEARVRTLKRQAARGNGARRTPAVRAA
jgi:transglutaminase-like putative cysteine protease